MVYDTYTCLCYVWKTSRLHRLKSSKCSITIRRARNLACFNHQWNHLKNPVPMILNMYPFHQDVARTQRLQLSSLVAYIILGKHCIFNNISGTPLFPTIQLPFDSPWKCDSNGTRVICFLERKCSPPRALFAYVIQEIIDKSITLEQLILPGWFWGR